MKREDASKYMKEGFAKAQENRAEVAERFNKGKPELWYWLLFPHTAEGVARVLEFGATKYKELNWTKGGKPDKEYLSAAMRHVMKHMRSMISRNPEDMYDEESGCLHLSHAVWNLCALIDLNLQNTPVKNGREV